ncbi:MAG: hypothetical protein Q4C30_00800 [Bacteroidia bacterium]|nr:hypothetical protein [Bacteroidia bacterium]
MKYIYLILFLICAGISSNALAQNVRTFAEMDSTVIYIGGQVGLDVVATFPKDADIHFLPLEGDSLSREVEIIERFKPDSVFEAEMMTIHQRYIVQSFDSGLHYIAPKPLLKLADNSTVDVEIPALNVLNPFNIEIDEQTQVAKITDIRDAMDAPWTIGELGEYLAWIIGGIVVIALIILAYMYYKRRAVGGTGEVIKPKKVEPCHVTALDNLNELKTKELWQHGHVKEYYSELTVILRVYIGARYDLNAMESTTDEIMSDLRSIPNIDMSDTTRMQNILEMADFAKFAKMEPLPDENDGAMRQAIEFVNNTAETSAIVSQ